MAGLRKIPAQPFIVFLAYCFSLGLGQFIGNFIGERLSFLSLLVLYFISIIPFGIIIPLRIAKQGDWKLHDPYSTNQLKAGILYSLMFIMIGLFSTGVYNRIIQDPSILNILVKHLMFDLPIGLGLCLNVLFLVPRAFQVHLGGGFIGTSVATLASGLAMGIAWMFYTLLGDFDSIMGMMLIGTLLGLGAALSRSVYITYGALAILLIISRLAEPVYSQEPLIALIAGFSLTFLIIALSIAKEKGWF